MRFEILIYCHNFQKRLCWTLSSILQQKYDIDKIIVNIASKRLQGIPTTERVIQEYGDKLQFKHTIYEDGDKWFAYPSITKNRQITESNADFIVCHSADHLFHPDFFAKVDECIKSGYNSFGSSWRIHTKLEDTNKMINKTHLAGGYIIDSVYDNALKIRHKTYIYPSPGGHLIIKRDIMNGKYVEDGECRDSNVFRRGMRTKTDRFTRQKFNVKNVKLPTMIHLNHNRDKEAGKHLEESR